MLDLSAAKRIHMVGIKGVGMTALAQWLVARGHAVSGSDVPETFFTDVVLRAHNIPVRTGFSSEHLAESVDMVIHSTAYSSSNPEIAEAMRRAIPILSYPEALGIIFSTNNGIAIAGSHGKTTTTAMTGSILARVNLRPTVIVGSYVPAFGGNALVGDSNLLVVETDEYQNKFVHYRPHHAILTNIEYDHPDFFPTPEAYEKVFEEFLSRIPDDGILAANADDPVTRRICRRINKKPVLFGCGRGARYRLIAARWNGSVQNCRIRYPSGEIEFSLRMSGKHNAMNATAAAAFAIEFGINPEEAAMALSEFSGTKRRFEMKGEFNGAPVIDDYAHHPTEVQAAISAAREQFPSSRVIAVFQPHTYSRTKALLHEFAKALAADENILLEVYGSAREHAQTVSSRDILALTSKKQNARVISSVEQASEYLRSTARRGDVILLMGAGDVWRIADLLLEQS